MTGENKEGKKTQKSVNIRNEDNGQVTNVRRREASEEWRAERAEQGLAVHFEASGRDTGFAMTPLKRTRCTRKR